METEIYKFEVFNSRPTEEQLTNSEYWDVLPPTAKGIMPIIAEEIAKDHLALGVIDEEPVFVAMMDEAGVKTVYEVTPRISVDYEVIKA